MAMIVGIDISKGWFDAAWRRAGGLTQARFSRDDAGLKELLERTPEDSHYVMEATGSYHLKVALFCHQAGRAVSVINPLVIKRYAQMNLMRAKTDAVDARLITEFGEQKAPALWHPPAAVEGDASWPLNWYLRHLDIVWSRPTAESKPPIVVVDPSAADDVEEMLGPNYTRQEIPLRVWWLPELSPAPLTPSPRQLLRYLVTREPWSPIGWQ